MGYMALSRELSEAVEVGGERGKNGRYGTCCAEKGSDGKVGSKLPAFRRRHKVVFMSKMVQQRGLELIYDVGRKDKVGESKLLPATDRVVS